MAYSLFDSVAPHLLRWLSDGQYAVLDHAWHARRWPRLHSPETISEKLTWLKIHYRDDLLRRCADKYLVRDYVRANVSEDILVPLIGVYDSAGDIDPQALPDAFILKATHGSGWNVICRSRRSFDFHAAASTLSKYLGKSYYWQGREWCYKDLRPRIVCEELLLDEAGEIPTDYKFWCFHGEPKFLQVHYTRYTAHRVNIYDVNWQVLPCRRTRWPNDPLTAGSPPAQLGHMLEVARILARSFPFVRVDLFAVGRRVFFGELTFYPGRGIPLFKPDQFNMIFGSYLDIPSIRDHVV